MEGGNFFMFTEKFSELREQSGLLADLCLFVHSTRDNRMNDIMTHLQLLESILEILHEKAKIIDKVVSDLFELDSVSRLYFGKDGD
jgi:hypothetical protein